MSHWLMKTEPSAYSIWDLEKEGKTPWEGVRNYQARNFMRDRMPIGDQVLIYHSNCDPPSAVGIGEVYSKPYPDYFAWDPKSKYFDPKSPKDNPRWIMVDIAYKETFKHPVSLKTIKAHPELQEMLVIKKGMRLSIQPVTKMEFDIICKLGRCGRS